MFGLVCCALLIGGSAFAGGGAPSPDTAATATPHGKKIAATRPKKRAPAPLSAAEQATTGNTNLPVTSGRPRETSSGSSWTGFEVGVGGGIGMSR
jgi:hypothetical protein